MDKENKTIEIEVIDIEEYSKAGKKVPPGRKYKIRIDKDNYTVDPAVMTGRQILAIAGKKPEEYNLYQHVRGSQTKTIEADEKVDLTKPGVERFTTLKRANTEGNN
ncbi:MAG TPA: multiubiquitin domain-containing protein [Pyrinomonadaceae bacterium]|nr:multiubiquitin domain-containing protein [Pyrinomonadaceae bacterium]